jgi:hypothetical protein
LHKFRTEKPIRNKFSRIEVNHSLVTDVAKPELERTIHDGTISSHIEFA